MAGVSLLTNKLSRVLIPRMLNSKLDFKWDKRQDSHVEIEWPYCSFISQSMCSDLDKTYCGGQSANKPQNTNQ